MDYSDFRISFHFDFKQDSQRKVEYHPVQEIKQDCHLMQIKELVKHRKVANQLAREI